MVDYRQVCDDRTVLDGWRGQNVSVRVATAEGMNLPKDDAFIPVMSAFVANALKNVGND